MAQLKDSVVQGSLRVTDTTYTNDLIVGDTTSPTIANHDYLLVADADNNNKILKGPVFDGLTVSKALTQKGTWENFTANTGTVTSITIKTTAPLTGGSNTATTTTGSYTIALANQNANLVLAGPGSGAAAAPAFRSLVAADLPTATTAALGIVKVGTNIGVSSGTISVATATTAALGVVKVGSNINVASGVISVTAASTSVSGVTKYGTAANTALQGNQNLFSLNGATKNAAAAASFYAPTESGTTGYTLVGAGTNTAPVWSNKGNGRIFYGTCSTAAATVPKDIVCPEYDSLQEGDIIVVKFTTTNSKAVNSITMNVNNTGTFAVKKLYNAALDNLTAVGEINSTVLGVFMYSISGSTGYWVLINADYNNTYDNAALYSAAGANRTAETSANGGIGIHRYSLQMMTKNYTWSSIASDYPAAATTNTATGIKTVASCNFLINSPIIYQDTNANAAPGGTANVNGYTALGINLQYSTISSSTAWSNLTIQKPVYLVGTLNADGYTFKLANPWWTQTIGTTENAIYIYLGLAYSTTNIYLSATHPIYQYKNSTIRDYIAIATESSYGAIKPGVGLAINDGTIKIDGIESMTDTTHAGNKALTKYGWKYHLPYYTPDETNWNTINGNLTGELRTFLINMAKSVGYQGIATVLCSNMSNSTYLLDGAYTCYLSSITREKNSIDYVSGTAILIPLLNLDEPQNSSAYLRNLSIVLITFDEEKVSLGFHRLTHKMKNKSYDYVLSANQWETNQSFTGPYHCNAYYNCPEIPGLKDQDVYYQAIVGMANNYEVRPNFNEEYDALSAAYLEPVLLHPSNYTSNGNLMLLCHGEIPTIDLHITLMIVG